MLCAILGRQPKLSLAELESYFGSDKVKPFSVNGAIIDQDEASIDQLGGTLKLARVDFSLQAQSSLEVLHQIEKYYSQNLPTDLGKITLGISWYGNNLNFKILNQTLLKIKHRLKKQSVSVRLLPVTAPTLSTATAHHNGLGKTAKKIEIIVLENRQDFIIGRSIGCQNISAYRDRDQKRPSRDSKVGMLPPKLAQIMINLARPLPHSTKPAQKLTLLDPFCGTGVILQEAHLLSFKIMGSDLEPRMIDYTRKNLTWLDKSLAQTNLTIGDATKLKWSGFDLIASESYLGKPFATPPTSSQIMTEKNYVSGIVSGFLKNLRPDLLPNAQICLAVPAWLRPDGHYEDLNLVKNIEDLGYKKKEFKHVVSNDLIYYRDGQSVARRLLVLQTK